MDLWKVGIILLKKILRNRTLVLSEKRGEIMEHIVQFGINIDDTAIKKAIENNVMNQVASSIKNDAMKSLTGKKNCTNFDYTSKLREILETVTCEFLEANKDEIIEETYKKLVERLSKTKAVKDMVNRTINSLLE